MNNFVEPADSQTDDIKWIINNLQIQDEINKWLCDMLPERMTVPCPSDFEDKLKEQIQFTRSNTLWFSPDAFKCFFLFDNPVLLDCFDANKLENERIKCIPVFFHPMGNGNGRIFNSWAAWVLPQIKQYADENVEFAKKYLHTLQENRKASTLVERVGNYISLQNFSSANDGKNLPSWVDIDKLTCEGTYPLNLVYEMEDIEETGTGGIPVFIFPRVLLLPFLFYGTEIYKQICCILDLIGFVRWRKNNIFTGDVRDLTDKIVPKITVPRWNKNDNIHWIFLDLAAVSKDISIIDRVFEGVDASEIPCIFYNYLLHRNNWGKIMAEDIRNRLRNENIIFSWESVYSDWLSQFILPDEDIFFLFFDYLEKLAAETSNNKTAVFQEMFFPSVRIRNYNERNTKSEMYELLLDIHSNKYLYDKLINVISQGMALCPVGGILPIEKMKTVDFLYGNDEAYTLDVFYSYLENISKIENDKLLKQSDALLIAEFWFLYLTDIHSRVESVKSKIEKISNMIYTHFFLPFINNENFVCQFLSVPFKLKSNDTNNINLFIWLSYYLACWVNPQKKQNGIHTVRKAAEVVMQKKVVFPEIIAELIRDKAKFILDFVKYSANVPNDHFNFLLTVYFSVCNDMPDDKFISEITLNRETQYKLHYILYRKRHDAFVSEFFLDYILSLKPETNINSAYDKNISYQIELLKYACEAGDISKNTVLEKLSCFITSKVNNNSEYCIALLSKLHPHLEYFLTAEDNENNSAKENFFIDFYEHAVNEPELSFTKLYCFLFFWIYYKQNAEILSGKYPDWIPVICNRCSKALHILKKNVNLEFPVPMAYYSEKEYLFYPAYFLRSKVSLWKGLKPLLSAFRAAKIPMLQGSLVCTHYNLPGEIEFFFRNKDQEKLRQLRRDMANDLITYLKPAKNQRNADDYTKIEIDSKGFDLSITEPSYFWRYAYVRALSDLGVKTDSRGNFIHSTLEYVSKNDPSEMVKKAAEKAVKELESLRKGMAGGNSKKQLYEAFWWMRQAHLLSLGVEIDQSAALKTRIAEWR